MIFLTGHGVAPGIAVKAFKRYGAGAIDVVRSNPYRLAEEIFGVGFLAVVLQQMLRRRRHDVVASLAGVVLLLCTIGSLASLLLLGRGSAGAGWARVALLVIGAALVVGHLVDLGLPRPQVAVDVPRGLLGLVLAVAAGAAVAFLGRGSVGLVDGRAALIYGAVLGGVAALMGLAASYLAVEASGDTRLSPWAIAVVQAVFPIAACAPLALALQSVL